MERILFNFLWNGPDKIRRHVAIGNYNNGGLQVPDIKSRIETQRVLWVKRLLHGVEHPWKEFPRLLFARFGGLNILNGNTDVLTLRTRLPHFYLEMVEAWQKVNGPSKRDDVICNTSLWCNAEVKIQGQSIFYRSWSEKGVNKVMDLFSGGSLHSWQTFKTSKNFTEKEIMKWNSLMTAVPKAWLKLPKETVNSVLRTELYMEVNGNTRDLCNITSKEVYCSIVQQRSVASPAVDFYCQKFNITIEEYTEAYERTVVTTIENKLRSFQLKILHNILYTNTRLFKMSIVDTEMCSLCKVEQETVSHLLVDCIHAKELWNKIITTWFNKISISHLTEKQIILGMSSGNASDIFVNHVILMGKYYLYKCRLTEKKVCFTDFCTSLRYTEMIELKIAEAKGKDNKHFVKWCLL